MSARTDIPDERLTLTLDEAARRLGVHVQTLRRAVNEGQLPIVQVGRRKLVPRRAFDDLLGGRSGDEPGRGS